MSDQFPEPDPYNMVSAAAFVYFTSDAHLLGFVNTLSAQASPEVRPFISLTLDLTFCRAVDNYLSYISDLLVLIFKTRPETMKSSKETILLDTVLRFSRYDDLLNAVTEQKVMNLSFLGTYKLDEHLRTHVKFPLFEKKEDLEQAVRIVETRNLLIHNRGIISARFLERLPDFTGKAGEGLKLSADVLSGDLTFLQKSVLDLDFRAGKKFQILRSCPVFGTVA